MIKSKRPVWLPESGRSIGLLITMLLIVPSLTGCGTTNQRKATEQLIMSDAIDRAIGEIDFSPLNGATVFFDDRYIRPVDGIGFVNAPYIISSLRQQLMASGCLLQEVREDAEIIVEARVGTLGADGHEMTFGIPKSSSLSTAATALSSAQVIPVIPEISFAKVDRQTGAAKVGVYAYERESKIAVWQSGVRTARSSSRDTYVLGAGPWQKGTIHRQPKLAGTAFGRGKDDSIYHVPPVDYHAEVIFPRLPAESSHATAELPATESQDSFPAETK